MSDEWMADPQPELAQPDAEYVLAVLQTVVQCSSRAIAVVYRLMREFPNAAVSPPGPSVAEQEQGRRSPDPVREALADLVALKDGPRDERYHERKPLAWDRARAALAAEQEPRWGGR